YCQDKRSATRMVELFPRHEYFGQITRFRRLVKKPTALLHLASLEKTRKEKKKPDSIRCRPRPCLRLEQNTERRLGNSTKSYSRHYHYFTTLEEKRICFLNRITLTT